MPSDSETLGFVVMEALASGLPSVGVRAGGLVDIIEHGKTGYLVANDDAMVEFSHSVRKLVADLPLRQNMSSAAVQWAHGWSWVAATSKLRNVQYRKALQLFQARMRHGRHVPEVENAIMEGTLI
jgi:sulfoquinovosyltransferase